MRAQPDAPCGYCGAPTKRQYEQGKGKNAKRQRPKWRVCERGHRLVRKVSQ